MAVENTAQLSFAAIDVAVNGSATVTHVVDKCADTVEDFPCEFVAFCPDFFNDANVLELLELSLINPAKRCRRL